MTTTRQFTARRNTKGNLSLRVDGVHFGTLYLRADGSVSGGSFQDPEVNDTFRRLRSMDATTVAGALVRARRAYELAHEEEDREVEWLEAAYGDASGPGQDFDCNAGL
jgi:hypothetical protein